VPTIAVSHFSDPGCPWAYSASPAHAVLRWRYGDQLAWRLVTIGLSEDPASYAERGYTPTRMALGNLRFRRHGMPFTSEPRARVAATARACRAIVATRLLDPEREHDVFRALQFGWFTTTLVLDEEDQIARALETVPGLDVAGIVGALDDEQVTSAYQADRAETRTAEGSPTHLQGKTAATDGPVRYTAPSVAFQADGRRLEAGGFQSIEAYDVLVANLDPTLDREPPPSGPLPALERFPDGLVTQEVAGIMAQNNEPPDPDSAEDALIELVADGRARRLPLGDDALWQRASAPR
jgi:protein-disulfide isomerase-like protein with CxxC motif